MPRNATFNAIPVDVAAWAVRDRPVFAAGRGITFGEIKNSAQDKKDTLIAKLPKSIHEQHRDLEITYDWVFYFNGISSNNGLYINAMDGNGSIRNLIPADSKVLYFNMKNNKIELVLYSLPEYLNSLAKEGDQIKVSTRVLNQDLTYV